MSLDIQIKVDPTQAVAGARQTREALARAEEQGERVRRAMNNLGGSFAGVAHAARAELASSLRQTGRAFDGMVEAIRREQTALERIRGAQHEHATNLETIESMYKRGVITGAEYTREVGRINAALGKTPGVVDPATNAFAGLAQAMQQEQQMLDRLHGPMRQVQQDLRVLDSLHRQGKLSAEQYAREIERLNVAAGNKPQGPQGHWKKFSSDAMKGAAVGFLAGAATSELQAGIKGVVETLREATSLPIGGAGTAIGFMFGGPLGAAVGTVGEALGNWLFKISSGAEETERWLKQLEGTTLSLSRAAQRVRDEFQGFNADAPETSMREIERSMAKFAEERDKLLAARPEGTARMINGVQFGFEPPDPAKLLAWMQAVEKLNEEEAQLEAQHRALKKAVDDANPSIGGVRRVLEGVHKPAKDATDAIISLKGALNELVQRTGGFRGPDGAIDRDFIELRRKLRDEEIKLAGATKEYGSVAADIRIKELQRKDSISDLKKAYADKAITTKEYTKALRELGVEESRASKLYKEIVGPQKEFAANQKALTALFESGKITVQQYNRALDEMIARISDPEVKRFLDAAFGTQQKPEPMVMNPWSGTSTGAFLSENAEFLEPEALQMSLSRYRALQEYDREVADGLFALEQEAARNIREQQPDLEADMKAAALQVDHLQEAIQKLNDGALQQMKELSFSIGDAFVSWITDAEFSWKKFADQMLKDMLRMSMRGLIQFGWNAAGLNGGRTGFDAMVPAGAAPFLPGFRTGGDMLVGGAGGPDTKIAAFRVSPGESIHVRTPQQRRDAQAAVAGQRKTVVLEMPDGRRTRYEMEADVEELVIRSIDRNMPALRARLTGR